MAIPVGSDALTASTRGRSKPGRHKGATQTAPPDHNDLSAMTCSTVPARVFRFYDAHMKVPLFNHIRLLRYAGLLTWACTGVPLLSSSWRADGIETGSTNYIGWWIAYLMFGAVYWLATRGLGRR